MVSEVNPARVEIVSELNQSEVNCTLFEAGRKGFLHFRILE